MEGQEESQKFTYEKISQIGNLMGDLTDEINEDIEKDREYKQELEKTIELIREVLKSMRFHRETLKLFDSSDDIVIRNMANRTFNEFDPKDLRRSITNWITSRVERYHDLILKLQTDRIRDQFKLYV